MDPEEQARLEAEQAAAQNLAAEGQVPAEAPFEVPVETSTGVAARPKDPRVAALEADLFANPDQSTSSSRTSGLVSAAPEWYKPLLGAPPKPKNPMMGNLAGLLAQGAVAGSGQPPVSYLLRGRNGYRPQWQPDAGRAQLAQKAGEAVSGAINYDPKAAEYDNNLAAAQKQASLQKTLSEKNGSRSERLGMLNYLLRDRQVGNAEDIQSAKLAEAQELGKDDSDLTNQEREAAVNAGMPPERANEMNGAQLRRYRTTLAQQNQREFRTNEYDYEHTTRQNAELSKEERAQERGVDKEKREGEEAKARAYIPGLNLVGPAPDPATFHKVREATAANRAATTALTRLEENQKKLQAYMRFGKWSDIFGQNVDQKKIHAQMVADLTTAQNAYRKNAEMGAPQDYELRLANLNAPPPDSLEGFASGEYRYPALRATLADQYREGRQSARYFAPGEDPGPVQAAPSETSTEDQIRRYNRAPAMRPTLGGRTEPAGDDYGVPSGDRLPVAPLPGATPPTGKNAELMQEAYRRAGGRAPAGGPPVAPQPAPQAAGPVKRNVQLITPSGKPWSGQLTDAELNKLLTRDPPFTIPGPPGGAEGQ